MSTFDYGTIIDEMVQDLKERVKDGDDVAEAAAEIADGSQYVTYTRYHYKVLDACSVDPSSVVSDFGIDFGSDFGRAIAQTVYGCLYCDMMEAFDGCTD